MINEPKSLGTCDQQNHYIRLKYMEYSIRNVLLAKNFAPKCADDGKGYWRLLLTLRCTTFLTLSVRVWDNNPRVISWCRLFQDIIFVHLCI